MNKMEYMFYALAERDYKKELLKRGLDPEKAIPPAWYGAEDRLAKIHLLVRAINEGKLLQELPDYDKVVPSGG